MNTRPAILWVAAAALLGATPAMAQAPDYIGPGDTAPSAAPSSSPFGSPAKPASETSPAASSSGASSQSRTLGQDVPYLDLASGTAEWDGRLWNIQNNRLLRARFEKYLNAPEQTDEDELAYRVLMNRMLDLLAPNNHPHRNIREASDLLPEASSYEIDANLCDALANTIYNVWRSRGQMNELARVNNQLRLQQEQAHRNAIASTRQDSLRTTPPRDELAAELWRKEIELRRDLRASPHIKRTAELEAMIKANAAKRELTEIQTKIDFQILVVQYFTQRRFQHVLLGSRFYQTVFSDGDISLRVGADLEKLFSDFTGSPPTLTVLETLSMEAMRDVREGITAFKFLVERGELASASERLLEAFAIGEYLPEVRSLPRDDKRKVLDFQQKANQLLSALEVRDYTLAEELTTSLQNMAKDFDASKPLAAIQTARTVSAMHLARARNAATSGDRATLETELKAATEIWPRNPDLSTFTQSIFSQADVQNQALNDLERLVSQRNYRQIFDDQMRYIAAVALYPDRQEQLRTILEEMQMVEATLIRSTELANRGDYAGAWESVELVAERFSYDTKLSQMRADLTTNAADFVRHLRTAQGLEERQQYGSSLAWYLNAQSVYPMSQIAREGIDRLTERVMATVRRAKQEELLESSAYPPPLPET